MTTQLKLPPLTLQFDDNEQNKSNDTKENNVKKTRKRKKKHKTLKVYRNLLGHSSPNNKIVRCTGCVWDKRNPHTDEKLSDDEYYSLHKGWIAKNQVDTDAVMNKIKEEVSNFKCRETDCDGVHFIVIEFNEQTGETTKFVNPCRQHYYQSGFGCALCLRYKIPSMWFWFLKNWNQRYMCELHECMNGATDVASNSKSIIERELNFYIGLSNATNDIKTNNDNNNNSGNNDNTNKSKNNDDDIENSLPSIRFIAYKRPQIISPKEFETRYANVNRISVISDPSFSQMRSNKGNKTIGGTMKKFIASNHEKYAQCEKKTKDELDDKHLYLVNWEKFKNKSCTLKYILLLFFVIIAT